MSVQNFVCTFGGSFGFATIDWKRPLEAWKFHRISTESAPEQFGHGLGVGDVNGDGKNDILTAAVGSSSPRKHRKSGCGRFTRPNSPTPMAARRCTPTMSTATATTT